MSGRVNLRPVLINTLSEIEYLTYKLGLKFKLQIVSCFLVLECSDEPRKKNKTIKKYIRTQDFLTKIWEV